jgi:hypothetical protein
MSETDLVELRTDWGRFAQHPNAEFEFYTLICKLRSEVLSPCVLALQRDGHTQAILAGRVEETAENLRFGYLRLWKMRVRRLCFVYGGNMGLIDGDAAHLFVRAVLKTLANQRLDYAEFSHLREGDPLVTAVRNSRPLLLKHQSGDLNVHYRLRVPARYSDFLARISNRRRFAKMSRILENDFPGQITIRRFTKEEEVPEFLRDAEAIAAQSYHRQLGAALRGDEEHRRRFELTARHGRFRGIIMYIKGQPGAYWCGTVFGDTLHLGATGYLPELRKYELGTLLFLRLLEDCCGTEVLRLDFGFGDAPYKQRFADESWLEETVHLYAPTFRGVMISCVRSLNFVTNQIAKRILDKLHVTQHLKTWWRQRLSQKNHGQSSL